jgi:ribosomal protein L11 methylase PrmA
MGALCQDLAYLSSRGAELHLLCRQALEQNPTLIRGSSVLDVGCGTGVLSFFAARGGAARVVGIDAAERVVTFANSICKANGLHESSGGPVAILSGAVFARECLYACCCISINLSAFACSSTLDLMHTHLW